MDIIANVISKELPDAIATHELGLALGRSLQPGAILLLEGDLGAGKTTLMQSVGKGLGIDEPIVSPTFTLVNEYHEGRVPLYHLDLYRLSPEHVSSLFIENYWDGIEVPLGIVAVEWSERLPELPDAYLKIRLSYNGEGRAVQITPVGDVSWSAGVLDTL